MAPESTSETFNFTIGQIDGPAAELYEPDDTRNFQYSHLLAEREPDKDIPWEEW
jgi:hypothetical protein